MTDSLLDRPFVNKLGISAPAELPVLSIQEIIEEVSRQTGVTTAELKGPRLSKHIVKARQLAMYRAVHETGKSLMQIGACFGNRDHTTVLNALRSHGRRIRREEILGS